ncbi:unnamed protein product [Tuber melanosporum]|uniref:(Perigord truffle) hypothetical protein n=1 Tax=Tuber melanosporum (strain Mel28) TaxID=656061 RepID=D5G5C5_TUBMM|nr:uncharacterized protein GSTUM_00004269001 [Tuber melanosporum]CAZ79718.1 unnamed protein product [Tuber melanosporum]
MADKLPKLLRNTASPLSFSIHNTHLFDMGNTQSGIGGPPAGDGEKGKDQKKEKPKYEPPPPTTRVGRRKRRTAAGPDAASKLPTVYPNARCKLKLLRMERIKDHLLLEEEFVQNQEQGRVGAEARGGAESLLQALSTTFPSCHLSIRISWSLGVPFCCTTNRSRLLVFLQRIQIL